ncbi:secretion-regulating guanine nucleotide exchange factor-like [Phlebotomus argentipes]|uniref:secretion-regulating guanine nucleotide exchange factor-like n=1 Tax=Phlebotomus argentipes TaxID=94469 RepID=UPI0028929BD4|nr:secretion-regulating guanine nucleotide exchange factor-like [Phlebotomus argentipes]
MCDSSGKSLFAWGANSHGQLAVGKESEMEAVPVRVDTSFLEADVRQICGGGGHTLILDTTGQVYACGWNNRGQLGLNDEENRSIFTKLPQEVFRGRKIGSIACGWDSSAAVTVDGELFMWGSNQFGQFCWINTKELSESNTPTMIPAPQRVSKVAFGLRHACILTEDGDLYLSGKSKCVPEGFLRLAGEKITDISTGQHHFVYRTISGAIQTRGDNKFNQLGDDSLEEFKSKAAELRCGWTHSGFLTNTGEIFLWGRNSYGQIGQHSDASVAIPSPLSVQEEIREFHLGSEHGLCVTKSGDVLTWGWNEHGNCGNGDTRDLFKPQKVSLPGKCRVAGVGAGFCFCLIT